MKLNNEKIMDIVYPIVALICFILLWHFVVVIFDMKEYILPSPFRIPQNIINSFSIIYNNLKVTLYETLLGFFISIIFGCSIAIAVTGCKTLDKMITPYIVLSQSFPKSSIAPLMIIWFGYGTLPKVVLSFLVGFFPITMNMIMGLKAPSSDLIDLLKSMSATGNQIFFKVRIPNSIPYLFSGIKICIPLCLVGAVVGEFIGANKGIGFLIIMANNELNTLLVFSALIALMFIGSILYYLAQIIEFKIASWYYFTRK
jgi:NitT/TauT family transport system permease protein